MNYSTLIGDKTTTGSIKRWANHAQIPSEIILTQAQQEIWKKLRVREMLETTEGTLAEGDDTVQLPSRYRQRHHLMFTGIERKTIVPKRLSQVLELHRYDRDGNRERGKPDCYATNATEIVFDRIAIKPYPYRFVHYATPESLGTVVQTNFLTEKYSTLLYATCMLKAYEWTKDTAQTRYWSVLVEKYMQEANVDNDIELAGTMMNVGEVLDY
jgi:hypothetical protein